MIASNPDSVPQNRRLWNKTGVRHPRPSFANDRSRHAETGMHAKNSGKPGIVTAVAAGPKAAAFKNARTGNAPHVFSNYWTARS